MQNENKMKGSTGAMDGSRDTVGDRLIKFFRDGCPVLSACGDMND
ncbi:hypothetical protein LCGC14_0421080 [marine sediment metagenome]|uniref:Uncharacterized protein n=1 Tax=marine sediment metagenome TaxID=412755 RepID=A0A0F9VCU9_9ZZZZ